MYSTVNATGSAQSIAFDFKQHYFALKDFSSNNVSTNVILKVGTPIATSELLFGHSYYYDTLLGATTVAVTYNASNTTVLYSNSITPGTYNLL
jgi:hypothetical protein